ncbi:MAG: hypothetical protein HQK54_18235 [Oligoflexales bacterium]|nr:hypothetical protein [Oligoflexales bacterium]
MLIVLDEIQWIAKRQSGILGALKEFWERVHHASRIKLILSGSSNRFFASDVDHPEGVLRGLRTRGDLTLPPFTLSEVKQYYFPHWGCEEVALVYMMVGGIPYYLENITANAPFLRALNTAFFTPDSIFLDEIDAMLRIETTGEGAVQNVKRVMSALGYDGRPAVKIEERTGLGCTSVHGILARLESYGLIKSRKPCGGNRQNRAGVRYYMDDFYLNTYFSLLEPLSQRIRSNRKQGMLVNDVIQSKTGYFIRDFTGNAFELLLKRVLEAGVYDVSARSIGIFKALGVGDSNIEISTYYIPEETQIDLLLTCHDCRQICVIEAKWKASAVDRQECLAFVQSVTNKPYPLPGKNWHRRNFLALSNGATPEGLNVASENQVVVITLKDLFE